MRHFIIVDDDYNYTGSYSGGYHKLPNANKAGEEFFKTVLYILGFLAGFFGMTLIRGFLGF